MVSSGLQEVLGTREMHNSHCKEMPGVGGGGLQIAQRVSSVIYCHLELFLGPSMFNLMLFMTFQECLCVVCTCTPSL